MWETAESSIQQSHHQTHQHRDVKTKPIIWLWTRTTWETMNLNKSVCKLVFYAQSTGVVISGQSWTSETQDVRNGWKQYRSKPSPHSSHQKPWCSFAPFCHRNSTCDSSLHGNSPLTCSTKSLPRKSAMVRGRRVRPHTKRRNRDRSAVVNSSITSQNHWTSGAVASMPLYVATDFSSVRGMSGLPHTCNTPPLHLSENCNQQSFPNTTFLIRRSARKLQCTVLSQLNLSHQRCVFFVRKLQRTVLSQLNLSHWMLCYKTKWAVLSKQPFSSEVLSENCNEVISQFNLFHLSKITNNHGVCVCMCVCT